MDAIDNASPIININPTLARTSSLYLSSFIISLSPPKDDGPQQAGFVVAVVVLVVDADGSIGVDDVDAMISNNQQRRGKGLQHQFHYLPSLLPDRENLEFC